jgi:hypothetical protein
MKKTTFAVLALLSIALTLPVWAESYNSTYPDACNVLWGAVKTALNVQQNYNVKNADETHMSADYQPKHQVHFDVSGVILQRENHVTLLPKGPGCEMHVVSNYSGWGHNDEGDFKKRVDEALKGIKDGKLVPPAAVTIHTQPAEAATSAK